MFFFSKANLLKSLCFIFSSLLLFSSFLIFLAPFLIVPFFYVYASYYQFVHFSRLSLLSSPTVSLSSFLSWPSLLLFGGSTTRIKRRQKKQSRGKSKGIYKEKTTRSYVIDYIIVFLRYVSLQEMILAMTNFILEWIKRLLFLVSSQNHKYICDSKPK